MQIDGMGAAQPKGVGIAPKSPQQAESKTADKGDEVSLNKPPKWAQVLIQQALQFALEINGQHYQAPKSHEFKLDPPEAITPETLFDYETVADNVLQFVTGRLGAARADGKSDEDLAKMMEQARKGVDMGFGDARKQLGDWADNEDIKTGMDQSYKLIQEGLESFEQEFFGEVSTTDLGAAKMASRQQAFLEIETRDGDKVMLRFSDSWQFKSRNDGSGSQFSLKSSQSFDFSLEGDLESGEMEAIGKLVKGLDELAGQFFGGRGGQDPGRQAGRVATGRQSAGLLLPQAQAVGPLEPDLSGGPFAAGGPQAAGGLSAEAEPVAAAGRCPVAACPAAGVDPCGTGGARPERGGRGRRFHGLQPAYAGGHEAARPADGDHLIPVRHLSDAAFASPDPGWQTALFSSQTMP